MNTLVQGYLAPNKDFDFNYHTKPLFSKEIPVYGCKPHPDFDRFSFSANGLYPVDESSSEGEIPQDLYVSRPEIFMEHDQNVTLSFISEMLMEEQDLEKQPCMLLDCLALQATEKSFVDALYDNTPRAKADSSTTHSSISSSNFSDFNSNQERELFVNESDFQSFGHPVSTFSVSSSSGESQIDVKSTGGIEEVTQFLFNGELVNNSRGKKHRHTEDGYDLSEEVPRNNKQLANNLSESEPLEQYDHVLLCKEFNHLGPFCYEAKKEEAKSQLDRNKPSKGSNQRRPKKGKNIVKEVVDLRSLLMQCAQAVANYDNRTVSDLLTRIRKHSSPQGDGNERVAHYFADALEARLAGTGPANYAGFLSKRMSAADILKAYCTFITACPFRKMSNSLGNRTILKLALGEEVKTLHIIDFGILYGYQWPCLIQRLSARPGGPPKLRITGVDLPQPGFRPAERVAETGIRLKKYCERFGVPFEYHAIAKKWETIKIEDLKLEKNELLVVNTLYRLQNVPDETSVVNSPRDDVLNLIKKINPSIFIHATTNGTYNTPFFVTRFRESLYHYSSMFDIFEETVPREYPQRVMFEKEVYGRDIMNIIACEGTERVERPETYKQWQVRFKRAGFKQLPLDEEIMKFVRYKVKTEYNKDFSVDEDGKWMLQGWKGRVNHAMSIWRPRK